MTAPRNDLGQPIGQPVPDWSRRDHPPWTPMVGATCTVEPLDLERHVDGLWQALSLDVERRNWTWLFSPPPEDFAAFRREIGPVAGLADPMCHVVVDAQTGQATGIASFMRIDQLHGVMEIGSINFSPLLQRTRAATEAMYLMMRRAFDELGYRRYEWKCDSLNTPSRAAAERLGFTYEGTFRQHFVNKGRNRDTAWLSIVDTEWPKIRDALELWLDPSNFDAAGNQRVSLSTLREK